MSIGYFVGIGSNVGASVHVPEAIRELLSIAPELMLSRVVRTEPSGIATQAPFLNAVAFLYSGLCGHELKARLNTIEARLGRDRSDPDRGRKDRTIDLDVLASVSVDMPGIAVEQIAEETYYRPQMLELIHVLGLNCCMAAEPVRGAVEVEFEGTRVGSTPVRIGGQERRMTAIRERQAALITGGAVRLGKAIAVSLAQAGYDIALHYHRSEEAARATATEIRDHGVRCELFRQDLCETARLDILVAEAMQKLTHLSVLVNSASAYTAADIAGTTADELDRQWTINFKAPFFLMQAFRRRVEFGSIINMLDNKIAYNQFHYAAYLSSKKALAELTKMAALEFAPGIRVNAVAPGVVLPSGARSEDYLRWREEGIPVGARGSPDHVCKAIRDLLTNRFVTGQIVFVDGGEAINFVGRNAATFPRLVTA